MAGDAIEHDETLLAGECATVEVPRVDLDGELLAERYRILGVLGEGGMGTVYRVHDRELDEEVALKVLRRDWIDAPGALERFRREVKLARRVTHRGIARTFDIGEHDGVRFLTMELVDGPSLGRVLLGSRPGVGESARIAVGIAEALAAAHAVGVIHHDLKPDNILLARDGRVVVTDFGIARFAAGAVAESGGDRVIGTPAYMAPEQVMARSTDARTDLYALGLVLFEMLCGRRPFVGDSALAVAAARLTESPADPRTFDPSIPLGLATLTLRLLARAPEDRPGSAEEVVAALRDAAAAPTGAALSAAPGPRPAFPLRERSLALYPIRTDGPPEDAWIGEGLTDELLDALCVVRGLRIKARVGPLAGEAPQAFGRRLGVDLVLEGAVRRRDRDLRLTLRLSTVADGYQVWAERFESPFAELFVVSDRAADAVARAAGETRRGAPRAPVDPEALELYLRARELLGRLAMEWREADALLGRACALAPDDPTILSAYAYTLALSEFEGDPDAAHRLERARVAAERALELAPHLAEPWVAIARVHYQGCDTPRAVRAVRRALANGPSVARAHDLAGRILIECDRLDDGARHLEIALSIDANLSYGVVDRIRIDALRGRWVAVRSRLDALQATLPEFAIMVGLRLNLWRREDFYGGAPTGRTRLLDLCLVHANQTIATGRIDPAAHAFFDGLIARGGPSSQSRRLFWQVKAEFHLAVHEVDAALDAVEASVAAGLEDLGWLRRCPLLVPLQRHPRLIVAAAVVEARAAATIAAWDEVVTGE